MLTRADLGADLRRLGVRPGDIVMAHAAVSRIGPLLDGPDTLVGALVEATSPGGTVVAYTDWEAPYHDLLDDDGRLPARWRDHVAGFDARVSRAARANGVLAEFVRTTPGAIRSANPGASVAALGERAAWITADHPLDHGYGPGTPLARVVEAGGKVVMVGAPHDTMTILHHAEHLADLPDKRVIRYDTALAGADGVRWHRTEEYDTSRPVAAFLDRLDPDPFESIVAAYLAAGRGATGTVGRAAATLVDAAGIVGFAVAWYGERLRDAVADGGA